MEFLFWLFFVGILVACLQDLKRREVDNWLNLFLLVSSFSFIFIRALMEKNGDFILLAGFVLVIMIGVMNLFYYSRVFAGGDAKLLVAMTAFFLGVNFVSSMINIGIFILFLMLSGSVYGLVYSLVLYFKDMKKINNKIRNGFSKLWIRYSVIAGILLFVFSYVNWIFLFLSIFSFLLPILYVFAKALEDVSMVRKVSGEQLREGDWMTKDVRVKGKIIKASWDGLSLDDIKLLKNKKKVEIKEGLPFVPAFLIAFLLYSFFKNWFVGFLIGLI